MLDGMISWVNKIMTNIPDIIKKNVIFLTIKKSNPERCLNRYYGIVVST